MSNQIDKQEFDKISSLSLSVNKFLCQVHSRFEYIMSTINEVFSVTRRWYDFDNGHGEADGHFCFEEYVVGVRYEGEPYFELLVIINDGEWNLGDSFPTRWLWEDFEKELKEGKELYDAKDGEKKRKAKEAAEKRKKEKAKLAQSAKSKLTREEKKALGI